MTTAIYQIISPSGAIYIGQSWDFEGRRKYYKNKLAYQQPLLYNSFKKYGFDSHELKILHELPNDVAQDVLNDYEIFYIQIYKEAGFKMMNLKEGGLGGRHHSDSIAKISKSLKGKKKPQGFGEALANRQRGIKFSKERIEKMRVSQTGKTISDASKKKMSASQFGRKHSEESKIKRSQKLKGLKRSDETKEKIRLSKTGTKRAFTSLEARQNLSNAAKEWCKNNPQKVRENILRMAELKKSKQ